MTLTDAEGASCSSSHALKKHDVFISFRGEDTRDNITSHIHAALLRNQIETYIDYRLEKGDEVWPALVEAIQDSTLFLVIFSENYASSTWCLNELFEIMECKKKGQHVIPVFYKVNPSNVRKQSGSYGSAFAKYEWDLKVQNFKGVVSRVANTFGYGFRSSDLENSEDLQKKWEKVQKWKAVLHHVANISGFDFCQYRTETELTEDIVKDVLKILDHSYPTESRGLCIVDQNYEDIEFLLRSRPQEVRFIGIWGMGGLGKTTIATTLFDKFSSQFEGKYCLKNVKEEAKRHGLNYLCQELFSTLLGGDFNVGTNIKSSWNITRLKRKKVVILLDDVSSSDQLKELVGEQGSLGAGSRVIVTARNKHVLESSGVDEIYEVKPMNFEDSSLLFNLNAFNKSYPEKGYEELSKRVIHYCRNMPLALKVLGSFLHSKSEGDWESALAKLKKIPNAEIHEVLKVSYDELDETEKNIFLDIACFFKGWERDRVTSILNGCDFFANIGITNLLDRALITISWYNCIEMHELLQEMGQQIVRQVPCKNLGCRSRLWDYKEICNVLKNNKGTDAIEGLFLDLTYVTGLNISSRTFQMMSDLRLLSFYYSGGAPNIDESVNLTDGFVSLPDTLRYFQWEAYPLKSLPSSFYLEMLVELSLKYSKVEKLWNGVQKLPILESLDLSFSRQLLELPDLCGAPNLKHVNLMECRKLQHIHASTLSLPNIEYLCLDGCNALKSLQGNSGQPSLPPHASDNITHLALGSTAINELPSSILHLRNLGKFSFPISKGLMKLPENFSHKIRLTDPINDDCDTFRTLGTALRCSGFRYVKILSLNFCRTLDALPESISQLSSLEELNLFGSKIKRLPESIKCLPRLRNVNLGSCETLLSIPELPPSLQFLQAVSCGSLMSVSSSTREPIKRKWGEFRFENCMKLNQHSLHTIMKDALKRIQFSAFAISFQDGEDAHTKKSTKHGKVLFSFPVGSIKVQKWLSYCSNEASITIAMPLSSNFYGLAFCVVLHQDQPGSKNNPKLGCNCYLETSGDQILNITSLYCGTLYYCTVGHVFIWYDANCCETIMKAVEKSEAENKGGPKDNQWLTFEFFGPSQNNETMIKECGLRFIYPS